jgi:hypothetical protein
MGGSGHQSAAAFVQLAALFMMSLWLILLASMGVVDGLVFRRVRFRYGVVVLGTVRGFGAQLIGILCLFAAVTSVVPAIAYIGLLRRYCGTNAGCFVVTPITGLFAHWSVIGLNVILLFCFVDWVRRRRREVAAPTDAVSFSLPNVHRYVNAKLALARERSMNRPEVERIMEFVDQHAPFVVLSGAKQVMDGKKLDHNKLATVFLADERFRNEGQRERIALEAVTEAYVAARQSR